MLKQRLITVAVVLPLLLAALFAAPAALWSALLGAVSAIGAWEWARLAKMGSYARAMFVGVVLTLGVALCVLESRLSGGLYAFGSATLGFALLILFWLIWVPLWLRRHWRPSNPWLMGLIGVLLLVPLWHAMYMLQPQPWKLLGLMAVVWVADTAAYFTGRKFGRRKLAPVISPGKTWEGVQGATVGVLLYVLGLALLFPGLFAAPLPMLAIGGLMLLLSIEGDLLESWVKRMANVKDSGSLLPGHGGVLDRIDALTGALPVGAFALWWLKPTVA